MPLRVGIDLVSADSVRESIREHGDRYLARVYTDAELRDCETPAGPDPERLAARFAAKEATVKVLRPGRDDAVPLRSIEVRRDPAGWVELRLLGQAAELAANAGVTDLALSFSHEAGFVSAVVIAEVAATSPPDASSASGTALQ